MQSFADSGLFPKEKLRMSITKLSMNYIYNIESYVSNANELMSTY